MTKLQNKYEIWRKHKAAHLIHHKIADYTLRRVDRATMPRTLVRLVEAYEELMEEADNLRL